MFRRHSAPNALGGLVRSPPQVRTRGESRKQQWLIEHLPLARHSQKTTGGSDLKPSLQMRKLRLREVKTLVKVTQPGIGSPTKCKARSPLSCLILCSPQPMVPQSPSAAMQLPSQEVRPPGCLVCHHSKGEPPNNSRGLRGRPDPGLAMPLPHSFLSTPDTACEVTSAKD